MISNNDILKMIFGFKLRYLRLEYGKSYHQLSEATGLSTSYLNDIEKGKKYPKPDKIELLAGAFGISYDELVSMKTDKKIQPVIDLVNSDFFKLFPMDEFGLSPEKILEIFTNAPDKTNAFIRTVIKIVRSYQIEKEDFYRVALRSYQDIHNNYFPELEQASRAYLRTKNLEGQRISAADLEGIMKQDLGIAVDKTTLGQVKELEELRSFLDVRANILYLNPELSSEQQVFILGREIGFHYLNLKERPFETRLNSEASFEKLLNNFKASYFSVAMMIPEEELAKEIRFMGEMNHWDGKYLMSMLNNFRCTPEMLLQRLTNILPTHFGLKNLFFIRLRRTKKGKYDMTKELHLSRIHNPYNNQLNEHLCRRWVSIRAIDELEEKKGYIIDAQLSQYPGKDHAYFCMSIAQEHALTRKSLPSSVTLGLLVTPELRATFNFLKDPNLVHKLVNTTCERCAIEDCKERASKPTVIDKAKQEENLEKALDRLTHRKSS